MCWTGEEVESDTLAEPLIVRMVLYVENDTLKWEKMQENIKYVVK